jgi:sugar lactone lactonase YvrE
MTETPRVAASGDAPTRSRRGRRIMAVVLAVLVALLGLSSYLLYRLIAAPTTKATAGRDSGVDPLGGLQWVRSIYGTSNQQKDQFSQTPGAVPGADGTIWVTDSTARKLMRFAPDGRYLGAVTSSDPSTPLFMPSRMAIGPDGLLYVCETTQGMVRVLRQDGTLEGSIGIPQPISVAVSQDRIAVGSVAGFAILDKTGKPINVVGTRGKGDDQFDYVHGIAIGPEGNIYVADAYNNRLSAYDRNGKRLWIVRTGSAANSAEMVNGMLAPQEASGTVLAGANALQLPLGLTLDGAGRIVVADMYDCALAVFEAKTGKFIAKYGEGGSEDGQFFYPVSVGYDSGRDWFTVADAMNKRIEIVRIPGSSGAGGIPAAVNRALAGPLRACLLPLLLLLLAIIVGLVVRRIRRRRAAAAAALDADSGNEPDGGAPEALGEKE